RKPFVTRSRSASASFLSDSPRYWHGTSEAAMQIACTRRARESSQRCWRPSTGQDAVLPHSPPSSAFPPLQWPSAWRNSTVFLSKRSGDFRSTMAGSVFVDTASTSSLAQERLPIPEISAVTQFRNYRARTVRHPCIERRAGRFRDIFKTDNGGAKLAVYRNAERTRHLRNIRSAPRTECEKVEQHGPYVCR